MATSPSLVVEFARQKDCVEIAHLSKVAVEYDLAWRWKPARILAAIKNKNTSVIQVRNTELAGFGIMEFHELYGHINLFATRSQFRRQGIGRLMLDWFVESAKVAGLSYLSLEVRANNASAIRFYEQLGFESQVVKHGYYEGKEDALRMRRQLIDPDFAARRP